MKKIFYKIIATAAVALSMVLPAVAHAQQSLIKLNGTAIVPVQSTWTLGNALTNGIFNSITVGSCTGCGAGGGGGSAANPIGGLQYSTPVGTTTGFAASANIKYSTTTQVLSILNSSTTNATTTNLAVTGLSNVFAFINSFGSVIAAANGSVSNALLANSAVTVTAGTGLSGGGSISLGSSATLNNTGVISVSCTTITCSGTNPASFSVGNGAISNAQLANNTIGISAGTGLSGGGTPALGGSATISLTVPVVATNGGTGTTTAPTLGQVLVGQANGTYAPQATSTLGITGSAGTNYLTNSGSNTFLNTGTNLQAFTLNATSTTSTSTFSGPVAVTSTTTTTNLRITSLSGTVLAVDNNGNVIATTTTGGAGTNYLTNSGSNTFLNTGTNLQANTLQATSTTATSSFAGPTIIRAPFNATTTISTQLGYSSINDGLTFLMPFTEGVGSTTYDYSASAQIGSITGGGRWQSGIIGNAFMLNPVSGHSTVTVPASNGFSIPTGNSSRTLLFWMKKPLAEFACIVDMGGSSGGQQFGGCQSGDRLYFYGNGNDCSAGGSDAVIDDNQWHFIAFDWNGTTMQLYVDGIAGTSCNLSSMTTTASPISIGYNNIGGGQWYSSTTTVQNVMIYNRALTSTEITSLYSRTGAGTVPVAQGGTGQTTALNASSIVGIMQLSPAGGGAPDFTKAPSFQGQLGNEYFGNGTDNLFFNPTTMGNNWFNAFSFPTGISSIGQDGQMPGGANNISTTNWSFNSAAGGYYATGDAGLILIQRSANPNQSGTSQCVAAMQNAGANGSSTVVDLVGNCLLSVPPNRNAGLDPAAGGWELNRHTNVTDGFVIGTPGGANNITLDTGNYPYFNGDFRTGLTGFGKWTQYAYLPTQSVWTINVTGVSTTPTGTYQAGSNIYTIDNTNLTGSSPNKSGTIIITGTSTPPSSGTLSKMVNDTDNNGVPTPGDSSVAFGTTTLTSAWNWALVTNLETGAVSVGSSSSSGLFSVYGAATTSTSTISNSNLLATFTGNVPNYAQVAIGNTATGSLASGDLTIFGDKGNASSSNYFLNLGYANTGTNDAAYPAIQANDGYLFVTDGGLDLGTATTSASSTIRFFTSGLSTTTERARITSAGSLFIGTTTGTQQLVVQNDALINGNLTVSGQVGAAYYVSFGPCSGGYLVDLNGFLNICGGKQLKDANGATGTDSQVLTKVAGVPAWANAGAGSNYFSNSGANTTLTTGSILNVATMIATSSIAIGTTTPAANSLVIQTATTSASTTIAFLVGSTTPVFTVLGNGSIGIGTSTSLDYAENIDTTNSTTTGGIRMVINNNSTGPVLNVTTKSGTAIVSILSGGSMTLGSVISASSYRASSAGSPAAPAFNNQAQTTGLFFSSDGKTAFYSSVLGATSTAWTATGFGVGSSSPASKFVVQGNSGSTTPLLTVASSSTATLFSVSANGTTTVGVLGSHFGTGASTAIPCVYDNTGAIGYITITSLLASGSCLAP